MLRIWFNFPQWFMNWIIPCFYFWGQLAQIGQFAAGAGQLAGGIGGLLGGGGEEDPYKRQKKDWYEYSKQLSREIMQHMRNEMARMQYEGFPGARNLRTMGSRFLRMSLFR